MCRTTAKFFALLDRQPRAELQHSLTRWHKRITSLFQLHQGDECAEVSSRVSQSLVLLSFQTSGCMISWSMLCTATIRVVAGSNSNGHFSSDVLAIASASLALCVHGWKQS